MNGKQQISNKLDSVYKQKCDVMAEGLQKQQRIDGVEEEPREVLEYSAIISIGQLFRNLREKNLGDCKITLEMLPVFGKIRVHVW
jgi:hypothetical protein